MLNLLMKYAYDHDLAPEPGFARKWVRWAIVCDANGRFLEVIELGDTAQRRNPGLVFPRCPDLPSFVVAAGDKGERRSHFLIEAAQVVVLYGLEPGDAKTESKHRYFLRLLREASPTMPEIAAAHRLLDDGDSIAQIRAALQSHKAKPTDSVTVNVAGTFPVESDAWHEWWRTFRDGLIAGKRSEDMMRCFATGDSAPPLLTWPKIKRLGGQPAGDALVCFDKAAFRSYGLDQSANAAVSEEAAVACCTALDDLVSNHSRALAGTRLIHWFSKSVPPEDDLLDWLHEPRELQESAAQDRASKLLESIRTGKRAHLADNHYYALTLSGMSGRIMIRDWMQGRFEELAANVKSWFDDLQIVRRDGKGLTLPPKFMAVLGSLVRDLDELPPPLGARMWRVAVNHEPIPHDALVRALIRARADVVTDQPPNHARMGLMKAYHIRKGDPHIMPGLNENHPHPAYHCGRLMAVLADLQRAALHNVNAGVVQRFYAAASSTPALVLGRLTRTSKFHLDKLDAGLAYWFDGRIADIWVKLDSVPRVLSLEEQSLFALGYYHQLAENRKKREVKEVLDEQIDGANTEEDNTNA
jgi:CRISPR-associated protein Csd1